MPLTSFDKLPDDARVWIFGAAAPVDHVDAAKLLAVVDTFLEQWKAHGHPLTAARDWRDERFLVIGVDQRTEGASGCSIDGLFRALQDLERAVGASLVGGGLVFFRASTLRFRGAGAPRRGRRHHFGVRYDDHERRRLSGALRGSGGRELARRTAAPALTTANALSGVRRRLRDTSVPA
jgi:hypothetical protein